MEGTYFIGAFTGPLDHQNSTGFTLHEEPVFSLFDAIECAFQDHLINQFNGARMVFQADEISLHRLLQGMKMDTNQSGLIGRKRHQVQFDFRDEKQCPFRSGNQF